MPWVLPCPTCFMPYVSSCLTGLDRYMLSRLTCLLPYVSRVLVPPCHTCFVLHLLSCPTFLALYVPRDIRTPRGLVLYMSRDILTLVPHVPRPLRVFCIMCLEANVLSCFTCLTALAPHCLKLCVSSICLKLYVLFCSLSLTCFKCSKSNMLSCMSCLVAFMCLLCFCSFNYLSFLQSRLRLITVLDRNKDTPNLNYINTLYPLRIATCVKNEFQNLQTGFQSNRGGFGWLCLCLKFKI